MATDLEQKVARGADLLEVMFHDLWPLLGDKLSDDDWEAIGRSFKDRVTPALSATNVIGLEERPQGDAGDALDWALGHCDASDALDFLEAWREGRADEEPAYMAWLALQRRCAALTNEDDHAPTK